jgi:hypothetical protein
MEIAEIFERLKQKNSDQTPSRQKIIITFGGLQVSSGHRPLKLQQNTSVSTGHGPALISSVINNNTTSAKQYKSSTTIQQRHCFHLSRMHTVVFDCRWHGGDRTLDSFFD